VFSTFIVRCTGNTSAIFFNITSCWIGRLYLDMTSTVTKNKPIYNKCSTLVSFELFFGLFFFRYGIYIFPLFSFHVHFCWGNQIKIWCLLDFFFSVKRSNKHLILIIGRLKLRTMIFSNVIFVYILCLKK
jgi:hypothetical protein